jgi:hypothetical protein
MFSKENRRFTGVLIAIVVVAVFGLSKVATLAEHDKNSATVWGAITFITLQLLAILRGTMSDQKATEDRNIIGRKVEEIAEKTNGHLAKAINQVAAKVEHAAHQPAPGQERMPATPDELRDFVRKVANDIGPKLAESICDELAVKAARVAAEAVRDAERAALAGGKCGHANPPDSVFCSTCGIRLKMSDPAKVWRNE